MIKRNRASTSYINNSLNRSSSKETHKFPKAERFIPEKKFSPDRFYDLPDTLQKNRGAGIGYGKKVDIILKELNDPARYVLRTQFEEIAQGYRFGVRPSLTPGLSKDYSQKKLKPSPESSPKRYSNSKMTPTKSKGPSPSKYLPSTAKKQKKLSQANQENSYMYERKSAKRLKYEYSQQCLLNNNRTSYTQFLNPNRNPKQSHPNRTPTKETQHSSFIDLDPRGSSPTRQKNTKCLHQHSTFSREERMKQKQLIPRHVGPGSYNVFSQFGDNLRFL